MFNGDANLEEVRANFIDVASFSGSDERPKAEWEEELVGSLTKVLVPIKYEL